MSVAATVALEAAERVGQLHPNLTFPIETVPENIYRLSFSGEGEGSSYLDSDICMRRSNKIYCILQITKCKAVLSKFIDSARFYRV